MNIFLWSFSVIIDFRLEGEIPSDNKEPSPVTSYKDLMNRLYMLALMISSPSMWATHTKSPRRWKTSTRKEFQWELCRHGLHTSRLVCNLRPPPCSPVQGWQHAIRTLIWSSNICFACVDKKKKKENMPHCVIQKEFFVLIIFPKCKTDLS